MKAIIQHSFLSFASHYTLESMLISISYWANYVFNNRTNLIDGFALKKSYSVKFNNRIIRGEVLLVQTWLIDLVYSIINTNNYGVNEIKSEETLYLIDLFNDYLDRKEAVLIKESKDPLLFVWGFFGEQKAFQNKSRYLDKYSRDKYILEDISNKHFTQNSTDYCFDFSEETGYTPEDYASTFFILFTFFVNCSHYGRKDQIIATITKNYSNPEYTWDFFYRYSIDAAKIRDNELERQILYKYPIIRLNDKYICSNPFLLLSSFSGAYYWLLRDKYKENNSQDFTNHFGVLFEYYVEEILENCLESNSYKRISENNKDKRADWYIKLGEYEFIIEQKSSLASLKIKQNHPNTDEMRKYIIKTWGEAINQLNRTQAALSIKSPIKIVLSYEDYFKCECLDKVFEYNQDLNNDKKNWLLSICEFEDLLCIYKIKPQLALKIIKEKDEAELSSSKDGRDLELFMIRHSINPGLYLKTFNISQQFDNIIKEITGNNSKKD